MTAQDLFDAYSNNETAANEKYNGKILAVSGMVIDHSTDKQGNSVILLRSNDPNSGVLCTFESSISDEQLEGKNIKLKGQCNGLLMDVVLNKCIFLEQI